MDYSLKNAKNKDINPRLSHVAIAVRSLKKLIPFYTQVLGLQAEYIEEVPSEEVKVALLRTENTYIELLEPLTSASPLYAFLEKHGEGLHHIAFETLDIEKTIFNFKAKDVQLLNEYAKSGLNNSNIIFIHPNVAGGVLIEYCEQIKSDNR